MSLLVYSLDTSAIQFLCHSRSDAHFFSLLLYNTPRIITVNYYDIFVRNAFGNYRDILQEIAYSPLQAERLKLMSSRSVAPIDAARGHATASLWRRFLASL